MVDLGDEELNKELKELEKQDIPSLKDIKKENSLLKKLEQKFKKKFLKK